MPAGLLARWRLAAYPTAVLIATLVMFWRGVSRMLGSELWAEDGQVFVAEALRIGAWTVFAPMAGYFHWVQRSIAVFWLAVAPLSWLAALICVSAFAVLVWVFATVARDDYAWLYPSQSARLWLVTLLCFSPGLGEVAGNLCNLNWVMFLRLALIGLKDPRIRLTHWDLAFAPVLLFSTAGVPLLLPLFLWRWAQTRDRRDATLVLFVVFSLVCVTGFIGNELVLPPFWDSVAFILNYWFLNLFVRPWFGEIWTVSLVRVWPAWILMSLKGVAGLVAARLVYRHAKEKTFQALALFALPTGAWLLLTFLGRTSGEIVWGAVNAIDANTWSHRWSFPAGAASILFWMGILAGRPRWFRAHPVLCSVFLISNVLVAMDHFHLRPYGAERRWKTQVPLLERAIKTGEPGEVRIRIYPSPWEVYFKKDSDS